MKKSISGWVAVTKKGFAREADSLRDYAHGCQKLDVCETEREKYADDNQQEGERRHALSDEGQGDGSERKNDGDRIHQEDGATGLVVGFAQQPVV